jgi:hypothetical protein
MTNLRLALLFSAAGSLSVLGALGCTSPAVKSGSGGAGSNGNGGPGSGNPGSAGSGAGGPSLGPSISIPDASAMPPPSSIMPTEAMNCGVNKYDLQRRPGDLLLILDRSGSMLEPVTVNGLPAEKWKETVDALDAVIKTTEATVSWGLKVFPIDNGCAVSPTVEVPVARNNHMNVMTAVNANPSMQGARTPTRDAIEKGLAFMQASPSTNAKYLVVATDGEPNCAAPMAAPADGGFGGGRNRNGSDAMATIAAVSAAAKAGIPSFIVGVATAGSDADVTLNSMAVEGGRPRNDPTTKYYPVASRNELIATLDAIATQVGSCTFPLNPAPPAPQNVAVKVDGTKVEQDPAQMGGWNYGPGNNSIVFFGAACEALKSGASKNVQIIFGCGNSVIN